MNTKKTLLVGVDSLKKAEGYLKRKNYGRAFAHYLVFMELIDFQRSEHEDQFVRTLWLWGNILSQRGQMEDLCKCYLQALNYFPLNTVLLSNFSSYLMRLGESEEARKYLQVAHDLAPDLLRIEKNLLTVKGQLVEPWHYQMLNDYERNMAYYKAILNFSFNGNAKALDIGTGCGLLTLFAANNDCVTSIDAVEHSHVISSIASEVFERNVITKATLHNKHSTKLTETEINGRAHLLLMEIFDVALFGEGVLESVIHAWENLLDEKEAKVIPSSARLYITAIESIDILRKHRAWKDFNDIKINDMCLISNAEAPYESMNLKEIHYTVLTETKQVLEISFSNLEQLKRLESDESYFEVVSLEVKQSGDLHAFAFWFDLTLDENIEITTDPTKENVKCWEQAVVHLSHPITCKAGSCIDVKVKFTDGKLTAILLEDEKCDKCIKVSPQVITFLNDDVLTESIEKMYNFLKNKVVLDTFPFPLLGLKYAKTPNNKCYCRITNQDDKLFIRYLCELNEIPPENVIILKDECLDEIVNNQILNFDLILLDLINSDGTLNENLYQNYHLYKNCLRPGGFIYPQRLNLVCELIECDYLNRFNTVNDENLFGFNIAQYINPYCVNERFDLEKNFSHTKLCDPINMGDISIREYNQILQKDVGCEQTKTGKPIDAILYWFEAVLNDNTLIDTSACTHYSYACFLHEGRSEARRDLRRRTIQLQMQEGLIKLTCR